MPAFQRYEVFPLQVKVPSGPSEFHCSYWFELKISHGGEPISDTGSEFYHLRYISVCSDLLHEILVRLMIAEHSIQFKQLYALSQVFVAWSK